MHLSLIESAVKVGLANGKITVKDLNDGTMIRELPFNDVDGISVFGAPQLSIQLLRGCIEKSVPVLFYSEDGHYFGHISSSEHVDPERQKRQVYATDDERFCLDWSKRIIQIKIQNSISLLISHPQIYEFDEGELHGLRHSLEYLDTADGVSQVLGFEGNAAKAYFSCLPKLIRNEPFIFTSRSTRPPLDPFNSMLSYGYSIIYRSIIGAIEAAGLHPYFAFMHTTKQGHAALASDLVEEWRAWLVDRTVLDLVNEGSIEPSDFYTNKAGAVYMEKGTMKLLSHRLGEAMANNESYFLEYGDKKCYGFQVALHKKMLQLIDAIEKRDPGLYKPFLWHNVSRLS